MAILNVNTGSAPSGYGQYDQLFSNNPYRNLSYNQSWLQRIGSWLGFRTGYDKFKEDAQINAQEWDSDVFALMQQNQYDSPVEQAQRMRAAGLNPDLQGLSDVQPAGQMRNDVNGLESTVPSEDFNMISTVAQGVLNIIPQAMSFATNLQQLKGIRLENDAKELSFGQSAVDAVNKFFIEGITSEMYKDAFDSGDWSNILDAAKKDSRYLSETLFSNESARKKWNLAYGMHQNSLIAKMQKYKTYDEFESARGSLLKKRASSYFSDDDDVMEGLLESFIQPVEKFQREMANFDLSILGLRDPKLEQGLKNKQMQNQLSYENNIDPALQAQTENASNEYTKQTQMIMQATNTLFEEIMQNLKGKDNWWSRIAMAFVGIARAQLLSGMSMQFGRRSQYSVDGDTGVLSETGQSNFGVSF